MKLIHSDQTGFIKWRHIVQNVRLVDDILQYTDIKKITRNPNNKQKTGKRESSNMAELEGVALIWSTMDQSNEWFIDSAATKHMTNKKSILENYVQYQEPKSIYLGDSTVILAHGEGKVKLPTVNSTREIVLDLHQVLFVPKLTKNLYFQVIWKWICVLYSDVESAFLKQRPFD